MAEKMARAMNPECFEPEVERVYGDLWAFDKQAKMKRMALAALEAMREPNDTVTQAGLDHIMRYHPFGYKGAWRCMIEQAILEAKGEEIQ